MKIILLPIKRNGRTVYRVLCSPVLGVDIPDEVTEALAKCYLKSAIEFYKDEKNLKAYEAWKKEQDIANSKSNPKSTKGDN